jgi:cell division protein FtsI (penicillin-binding protein 3)
MKKRKKNNNYNKNQTSFYFEDYLETNKKNKSIKKNNLFQDRIYLLFFLFFSLILIFSIRIIHVSLNKIEVFNQNNASKKFTLLRRDIIDRNGVLISRNIKSYHAAINPRLVNNKENFLLKLRVSFPDLPIDRIEEKLNKNRYFYFKKRLNQKDKEKLWNLGEKGIIFESFQSRIYTHGSLFSHIIGQVEYQE